MGLYDLLKGFFRYKEQVWKDDEISFMKETKKHTKKGEVLDDSYVFRLESIVDKAERARSILGESFRNELTGTEDVITEGAFVLRERPRIRNHRIAYQRADHIFTPVSACHLQGTASLVQV